MIKVLHNNNCSKSRSVLEYLDENGVAFEVIDIVEHPLSEEEIRTVLKKLDMKPEGIVRKNEALYREKFADQQLSDDEWITLLSQHPELIERPILIQGPVALIGRPVENVRFFIDK